MKLRRPSARPMPETIVALIDVVFFLLVFFMLIGRLDATAPFDVLPPVAASGADMPGGGITVSIAADGATALDGMPVDRDTLLVRMRDRLGADGRQLVRVNADQRAALRHVLPLVDRIKAIGARDVALVVTPNPP